ncbi:type III-B CRISPR-associated protein Cas10/Cmr2 [Spirosoma sordidisoli]|uniref:Type III-B CRISPR-associated protein Cas10/Cmr2 n=1 Tax=Spirosoma sordidisoli TaxID=2502893 RepID=A0A4Q2UL48_9BACT|nr:type III-B CRISPR-associated protein Cas10/Cmr2 [Spirosoma sordidisoli]RYC70034.1 type III-B CRISPR-associated protein Cas10/Cmr2 [Spirosoma sordidisoli]
MPNYYLAFTIGPIYRTMDGARFTRELWASSYLFSYLVKEVTRRIQQKIPAGTFIVPAIVDGLDDLYKPAAERKKNAQGAGLFPDRFILQIPEPGQLSTLEKIIDDTLIDLTEQMRLTASINGNVLTFLRNYLQLYALEIPVEPDQNVIQAIMPYLDTLELQRSINSTDQSFLRDLFDRVTKSFLTDDAFGSNHSFETILEVAARDFSDTNEYKAIGAKRSGRKSTNSGPVSFSEAIKPVSEDSEEIGETDPVAEENKLIAYLSTHNAATATPVPTRIFRPAHKYIAVVQADGDNVGKVIAKLKPDDYQKFSKSLSDFAINAAEEIARYGGMNIYAGGDDLLFFAPVLRQNETIFDLLIRLDKLFTTAFSAKQFPVGEGNHSPTLSFGVSITYYKFPLFEARQAAARQLVGVAKQTDGKNTIGLRIQKHSGQPLEGAFRINSDSFQHLIGLLNTAKTDADRTLTSVMHKIRENEFLLKQIGSDKAALQAFFDNSFNEEIHQDDAKAFLDIVVLLLNDCFTDYPDKPDTAIRSAYALLRTHGFLTSTELN